MAHVKPEGHISIAANGSFDQGEHQVNRCLMAVSVRSLDIGVSLSIIRPF